MSGPSQYVLTREFLQLLDNKISHETLRMMLVRGELDAIRPTPRGRYFINAAEAERLLRPIGGEQ